MKRFAIAFLCIAALVLSVSAVNAADPNGWNRSGLYVGALGGYSAADLKAALDDGEGGGGKFKLSDGKLFAGAMAGFNWRAAPDMVVGIEVDYLFLDVKGTRDDVGVSVTATSSYLASIRARVGLPIGPALLYFTAGPAFTNQKLFGETEEGSASKSDMLIGAAVGGGIEAELTRSMFIRAEGIHYWFPDKTTLSEGEATLKSGQSQTVGRIGLGFKLN